MVLDNDLLLIIDVEISQEFSLFLNESLAKSMDFQLESFINEKTFATFSSFVGSVLIILAQISILNRTNTFEDLLARIFHSIRSSVDNQASDFEKCQESFRICLPKFVDVWWNSLSASKSMKCMEKCFLFTGIYSDQQIANSVECCNMNALSSP